MFDINEQLDELRCRPLDWLHARRDQLEHIERRAHIERLAVIKVLDERGQAEIVDTGTSARVARETLEMARALESRPAIADAAYRGDISREQLKPVLEVSDESTDREWAVRAPNYSPEDLNRAARQQRTVTADEAAARREARELLCWWEKRSGMLALRARIPDVDGALVKSVLEHMVEHMRPAKGQRWDTYAHRGCDAFVELCQSYADVEPTYRSKPRVVINVEADGYADVDGIPIAAETLDAVLGDATVEQMTVKDGAPLSFGPGRRTLPARLDRAIRLRDVHCRWPGCNRTRGTQVHHIVPVSEGGLTEPGNLTLVCKQHHQMLEPHGSYRFVGNPNQVDGLRLVRRGQPAEARAGPAP